ncbi:UNVERIFIED_CONTAM: hypothetical protein RMT77_014771 [Armadillidium vulgare]
MFVFAYVVFVLGVELTSVKGNPVSPSGNLIEVANQNGFDIFIELLTAANLKHRLEGNDEFIIFTPTNQAFEKMGKPELSRLKSDPESLERILLSHISPQEKHPEGIFDGISLQTLNPDAELNISFTGNGEFVNGKEFNENGIEAKNGILYPTNEVLYSPINNDNHNLMIKEESSGSDNLIKVLNDNGCKNFALLITESDLPDLKISGPYTIFCPNEEAFATLSSDELRVMKSNEILVNNLIKSHIVEGGFLSKTLEDGMVIESLSSGYFFKFMIKDGSITVNNVPIIVRDLKASNGVVHVISNILISSSKRIRTENLPAVLKTTEDSVTNVEHMVASVVEVTGLMVEDSSKNNTSFYVAVNENADLLPSTVDETSAQETPLNGEDHNTTPNEDFATTMNTLEENKSESDLTEGTENESDSSGHLDSEDPIELPKKREEASNNTSEEGAKINVENVTEENLDNENENNKNRETNSSTENLKRLDEDSSLNESTTESQDEDSATTVAAEVESSSPSESSMDEAEITNSTLTINE